MASGLTQRRPRGATLRRRGAGDEDVSMTSGAHEPDRTHERSGRRMSMAGENATLAQQLVDAWNSLDPERVLSLLADEHVYEDVTFGAVNRSPAETRRFFEGAYAAFPDIQFDATASVVGAERGALEWTMTGTHRGDMPGLPATGKPFRVRGATVFEIAGGKISGVHDYWDSATLLRQLGLMPGTPTT